MAWTVALMSAELVGLTRELATCSGCIRIRNQRPPAMNQHPHKINTLSQPPDIAGGSRALSLDDVNGQSMVKEPVIESDAAMDQRVAAHWRHSLWVESPSRTGTVPRDYSKTGNILSKDRSLPAAILLQADGSSSFSIRTVMYSLRRCRPDG
jgi:hypothetical protein